MLLNVLRVSSAAFVVLLASGCGLRSPYDTAGQGPLSIPSPGETRIVSRQIGDRTPDNLHWKWSLISGSNWTDAIGQGTNLSLVKPYALNDPTRLHGTNVFECDLTAQRLPAKPNTIHWTAILHGSNGSTARTEGDTPLTTDMERSIHILVDSDTVQRLPSKVALAQIGDHDLTLTLPAAN